MTTTHYNTVTILDRTGETSNFTVYNDAITAVSIEGFLAQLTDFRAKCQALSVGAIIRTTWVGDADDTPVDAATLSNLAQRENKLLVTYEDTTTHEKYNLTIPAIDLTKLAFVPGAKDAVRLDSSAAITAWIAAFEALASPPEDMTHAVKVLKMRFVGRNS